MRGEIFVNMYRLHWNATIGRFHNYFFDSIEVFQIQYVFGKFKCNPEYCNRKHLAKLIDAIFSKCVRLYRKSLVRNQFASLNFEFNSIIDEVEISLLVGDSAIRIRIKPKEEIYD